MFLVCLVMTRVALQVHRFSKTSLSARTVTCKDIHRYSGRHARFLDFFGRWEARFATHEYSTCFPVESEDEILALHTKDYHESTRFTEIYLLDPNPELETEGTCPGHLVIGERITATGKSSWKKDIVHHEMERRNQIVRRYTGAV